MANRVDTFYVEILKKVQEDRLFQQQKEYKVDETRHYGPRRDCTFRKEGTFGPTSSRNFIGHPTRGIWDIKI